jgi:hypothetical protein
VPCSSPNEPRCCPSRDAEFVAVILKAYTGMRWGELIGLETGYVRPDSIRIEWQLYELDTGELVRCPPKDDSYRTIDAPAWLSRLALEHIAHTSPAACPCHDKRYVFRGRGTAGPGQSAPTLADVARRAEVAVGTVSTVFNHPDRVAPATAERVHAAVADRGFVRGRAKIEPVPHWRRNGFATWLFGPAVSGWYPQEGTPPSPAGADPRRTLARRARTRPQRTRTRRRLLAAGRHRAHPARATALSPHTPRRARHREGPHG